MCKKLGFECLFCTYLSLGTGTEHMIVCLLDRTLKLLDQHPDRSAVIASYLDWASAFDRQDPTIAIKKFIQLGVRLPSYFYISAIYRAVE